MEQSIANPANTNTVDNVQFVCRQIQADIDYRMQEQKAMDKDEKFKSLHKINELKQILASIEDIDESVNVLLKQQASKHSSPI